MAIVIMLFAFVMFAGKIHETLANQAPYLFRGLQQEMSSARGQNIFADVKSLLRKKTKVPLRLPGYLPDAGDKDNPLYAILESADEREYEIQLAWDIDCTGGNNCHYGTVRGSVDPLVEEDRTRVPV